MAPPRTSAAPMFLASCCAIITDLIDRSVNFSNTAFTASERLLRQLGLPGSASVLRPAGAWQGLAALPARPSCTGLACAGSSAAIGTCLLPLQLLPALRMGRVNDIWGWIT